MPASTVSLNGSVIIATWTQPVPNHGPRQMEVALATDDGFPQDSLVFSVLSLSCTNCTGQDGWSEMVQLTFLNLSIALPQCGNTVGAAYDVEFGLSLIPADFETATSGVTAPSDVVACTLLASSYPSSARCIANGGAHCGAASLWGGPRKGLLPSIEAAEKAFSLPSPSTASGTWLKTSAMASTGYFLVSGVGAANFGRMLELAKMSGMKMIVLLDPFGESSDEGGSGGGHFNISSGRWNGTAGLAAAIQRAHAEGIYVGLHTMSASIPSQVSTGHPIARRPKVFRSLPAKSSCFLLHCFRRTLTSRRCRTLVWLRHRAGLCKAASTPQRRSMLC